MTTQHHRPAFSALTLPLPPSSRRGMGSPDGPNSHAFGNLLLSRWDYSSPVFRMLLPEAGPLRRRFRKRAPASAPATC